MVNPGDATGWFEELYAAAALDEATVPWDRGEPQALLVDWARARGLDRPGRRDGTEPRALVVGCGLGRDAEYLAGLGFATVGFDISPTAIRLARERHRGSTVEYVTADLFDPPARWIEAYQLVVESLTVQALPDPPRAEAIQRVTRFVAPGGTLVVIAYAQPDDQPAVPGSGPPWPLRRSEIEAFATGGLRAVRVEAIRLPAEPEVLRWRAEFHRPEAN